MKNLICIIPNFDFGIYCDGENVDVFGENLIAAKTKIGE